MAEKEKGLERTETKTKMRHESFGALVIVAAPA